MRFSSRTIKGDPVGRMRLVVRLAALIVEAQRGPLPKIERLAETHGVSRRTISRDLSAIESVLPVRRYGSEAD